MHLKKDQNKVKLQQFTATSLRDVPSPLAKADCFYGRESTHYVCAPPTLIPVRERRTVQYHLTLKRFGSADRRGRDALTGTLDP